MIQEIYYKNNMLIALNVYADSCKNKKKKVYCTRKLEIFNSKKKEENENVEMEKNSSIFTDIYYGV